MDKKPNIILITVDALRADHLGFMGYEKNISPNLDKLAEESAVFTQAFSVSSSTPCSFPSILTSTYPLDYQGPQKIERPRILISEVFKKAGYITAAFHSNPFLSEFFGYNQGWDFFEDITLPTSRLTIRKSSGSFLKELFKNLSFSFFPSLFFRTKYLGYRLKKNDLIHKVRANFLNQMVENFVKSVKNEKRPFFLWIHYMDVHSPYFSREDCYKNKPCPYSEVVSGNYISYFVKYYQKKRLKKLYQKNLNKTINLYDKEIEYIDKKIGDLLKFLKQDNIYNNSIIAITADHGDEFLEHNGLGHGGVSYFSNKLYNELLHVPLLIKIPGKSGSKKEKKVSLIDLASTLCDLSEIKTPFSFKGKNLFQSSTYPLFHQVTLGITDNQVTTVQLKKELAQYKISCQLNNWKYILSNFDSSEELYNLSEDPKEQKNLFKSEPEILSQMQNQIQKFKKNNPPLYLSKYAKSI